jgi:hypothetical protein
MMISLVFYLFVISRLHALFQVVLADTLQMRERVGLGPAIQERVKNWRLLVDKPLRVFPLHAHA